jgi:hypothetical protein
MKPQILFSDNGHEFVNKDVKAVLDKHKVRHLVTRAYEPLGLIERFNQTLMRMLVHDIAKTSRRHSIEAHVKLTVRKYNHIPHSAHKRTPAEVHFSGLEQREGVWVYAPSEHSEVTRWNAENIVRHNIAKANDEVKPYAVGDDIYVHVRDWPTLNNNQRKVLFTQTATKGIERVMVSLGIPVSPKHAKFRIRSVTTVKGSPPVYLYQLKSVPHPGEPEQLYDIYYTHNQLKRL